MYIYTHMSFLCTISCCSTMPIGYKLWISKRSFECNSQSEFRRAGVEIWLVPFRKGFFKGRLGNKPRWWDDLAKSSLFLMGPPGPLWAGPLWAGPLWAGPLWAPLGPSLWAPVALWELICRPEPGPRWPAAYKLISTLSQCKPIVYRL